MMESTHSESFRFCLQHEASKANSLKFPWMSLILNTQPCRLDITTATATKGLMTSRSPVAPTHNIQKFPSTQIFGGNQTQYLTGWPNAFTLTFEVNSQNRWMTISPQYTQQKQSHEFQLWGAQSFIAYTNSLKWGGEKLSTVSFCIN